MLKRIINKELIFLKNSNKSSYLLAIVITSILILSSVSFVTNNDNNTVAGFPPKSVVSNNHPPIAQNINITVPYTIPASLGLKGIDQDGDKLNFTIVTKPVNGNITSFDPSTGAVTWKPRDYLYSGGGDSFSFIVTDTKGAVSNVAVVSIRVQ